LDHVGGWHKSKTIDHFGREYAAELELEVVSEVEHLFWHYGVIFRFANVGHFEVVDIP
jgi:hypothetical protein